MDQETEVYANCGHSLFLHKRAEVSMLQTFNIQHSIAMNVENAEKAGICQLSDWSMNSFTLKTA